MPTDLADQLADIPTPDDAGWVGEWWDTGHGISRNFDGLERTSGGITASIRGEQSSDGTIRRWAEVRPTERGTGGKLDAEQARELAFALADLADELEMLTRAETPAGKDKVTRRTR